MKNVIKVVLLMCFSLGILAASSPERLEKMKEEQAFRKAALKQTQATAATSMWAPAFIGAGITIKHFDYRPSGVIWAVGFDAAKDIAFYSADNGGSWSRTDLPVTANVGYTNISSNSDSTAVIGDYDGNILRSADKGKTWTKVYTYSTPDTAYFDGIKFISNTVAFAIGDADVNGLHVTKTTDGGLTWNRVTNLPDSAKTAYRFFASSTYGQIMQAVGSTIWIAYYSASAPRRMIAPVIKSTDAGATWTFTETPTLRGTTNNYYFRSMAFVDGNIGFAVGRQVNSAAPTLLNPLHKTTDGGATWSDTLALPGGLANSRVYVPYVIPGTKNVFFMGQSGANHGSWSSADSGKTFSTILAPTTAGAFRAIGAKDASTILGGSGSGLYKYTPTVKVTFIANTSGIPDTLKANSYIQIRGGAANLTWDNLSPAKMTNLGTALNPSDYWTFTGYFPAGQSFNYKFFTNAKSAITGADNGWDAGNDRPIVVGQNDTTLVVQYANGFDGAAGQFAAPFPTGKTDTVVAYLRVNMKSFENFDPAKHKVGVRGSFAASGWGNTVIMKAEKAHANGGQGNYDSPEKFYNVPIYWKKSLLDSASAEKTMRFKFVIHNINAPTTEDWSLMVDNPDYQIEFTMPKKDTTVYWKWYRGVAYVPPSGKDTINVKFRVDLSTATQQKGFKAGDTVIVKSGFDLTASAVYIDTLKKVGVTGAIYETANRSIVGVAAGKALNYQYYSLYNLTEVREVFYDYDYAGSDNKAERRKFLVPTKNLTYTIADTSVFVDRMNRRPTFQSKAKLARNVNVTFTVDLRSASAHLNIGDTIFAIQSSYKNLTKADKDSIYTFGVWINGPAVGGWGNTNGDWGNGLKENLAKKMYDDATNGDKVAGDRIYSRSYKFYKDSANNTVGQVFKFGIGGGDNEAGKGGFGNNHVRNIDDADTIATIAEDFGSINPKYYRAWSFTEHKVLLSVQRMNDLVPAVYELSQNYPNPFNPTTTINYAIPTDGLVSMKIYNILGQEVATLVNKVQVAGVYQATFNASSLSSGVYFYKIESGSFSSIKKMMLLK
jgi:photosystem II stability/assembly factor-like uncharacterized protein